MKQLLDHLQESGIYTEADLLPFGSRLSELREIIRKDGEGGRHPPQLTKLMTRKLEVCEKMLRKLESTLKVLSVELVPHSIRRSFPSVDSWPQQPPSQSRHEQRSSSCRRSCERSMQSVSTANSSVREVVRSRQVRLSSSVCWRSASRSVTT